MFQDPVSLPLSVLGEWHVGERFSVVPFHAAGFVLGDERYK